MLVAGGQAGQCRSDEAADAEAEDFHVLGLQAVGEGEGVATHVGYSVADQDQNLKSGLVKIVLKKPTIVTSGKYIIELGE